MKNFTLLGLLLLFNLSFGQEQINPAPIPESKLKINVTLTSNNRVTVKISPTIDFNKDDIGKIGEAGFPLEFNATPFNALTFNDKLMQKFIELHKYQANTDLLKKDINSMITEHKKRLVDFLIENISSQELSKFFSELDGPDKIAKQLEQYDDSKSEWIEFKKFISDLSKKRIDFLELSFYENLDELVTKEKVKDSSYFSAKEKIKKNIDALFLYFDAQLDILKRYDTEPVAGNLFYNTKITPIIYYQNDSYETYFQNKKRKYHNLIRKLNRLQEKDINLDSTNSNFDSIIKKYLINKDSITLSVNKEVDSNLEQSKNEYEKIIKDIDNVFSLEGLSDIVEKTISYQNIEYNRLYIKIIKDRDNENVSDSIRNKLSDLKEETLELFDVDISDDDEYSLLEENLDKLEKQIDLIYKDAKSIIDLKKIKFESIVSDEIKKNKDKYENDTTVRNQIMEIVDYFNTDNNISYYEKPTKFLNDFKNIIENYRLYNRKRRNKLILEKILSDENYKTYNKLKASIDFYNKARTKNNNCAVKEEIKSYFIDLQEIIKTHTQNLQNKNQINNIKNNIEDLKYFSFQNNIKLDSLKNFGSNLGMVRKAIDTISDKEKKENLISKFEIIESTYSIEREWYNNRYYDKSLKDLSEQTYIKDNDITKYKGLDLIKLINLMLKENKEIEIEINKILERDEFILFNFKYYLNVIKSSLENNTDYYDYYILDLESVFNCSSKLENINSQQLYLSKIKKLLKEEVPLWEFTADDIQIDFNDGFVEHIVMTGKITGISTENNQDEEFNKDLKKIIDDNPDWGININKQLKFTNQFPYGFSSSKDFEDFKEYKMSVYKGKQKEFEVEIEKIFPNYVQALRNDRLDFSPKDQVLKLPIGDEKEGSTELKKEKSSKLFNLSVYSDFNGLEENEPNGILQFEFNKNIPLYTKRFPSAWGERYINRGFNYGYLNYVNPQLRWSRLSNDDNDKNLSLTYLPVFEGDNLINIRYVTQLDLLSYENISVGADFNLFLIDLPTSKMRLEINASGRYGRTNVLDTEGESASNVDGTTNVVETFDINTWRFYPEFILRLRPEERYGAMVAFRPMRFNTVTNSFSTISSEESFTRDLQDDKQWLHQISFDAYFSPSGRKDDRFFFRYRYTNNAKWEYNGFGEIQLGYSMSLKF